ncbi:hypothetical protein E2C01_063314 [Portunus trituberculatus]|uniref:Uncharacterized protein n=1 Tax=Portunus trituberculatus TaxID=210409 RepID=A0A5B7HH89_PORTR|nr:hypothetical protein [Portunus trituberculatus]
MTCYRSWWLRRPAPSIINAPTTQRVEGLRSRALGSKITGRNKPKAADVLRLKNLLLGSASAYISRNVLSRYNSGASGPQAIFQT